MKIDLRVKICGNLGAQIGNKHYFSIKTFWFLPNTPQKKKNTNKKWICIGPTKYWDTSDLAKSEASVISTQSGIQSVKSVKGLPSLSLILHKNQTSTTSLTTNCSKHFETTSNWAFQTQLMALLTPQLQKFLLTKLIHCSSSFKPPKKYTSSSTTTKTRTPCCSAIAIDAPSSLTGGVAGVRWGSKALQGLREEMEDDILVRSDGFDGFYFAAVFDGHGGLSSVKFLRLDYMEICVIK